jgi:acyl carrier protein
VPNSRVADDARAFELLQRSEHEMVGGMRRGLRSAAGASAAVDPEDLWDLAAELGYSVDVGWYGDDATGRFDVLFWPRTVERPNFTPGPGAGDATTSGTRYANRPATRSVTRTLVAELRRHLAAWLPEHMVPQAFVLLHTLPLTPNGKIDRRALPEPGQTPAPVHYEPPRTSAEQIIAEIWALLLNVERVGMRDNFFDLGGHSLLAARLMSRIRQAFRIELPLRTIFEAPTLAALAARVVAAQGSGAADLPPALAPAPREAYRRTGGNAGRS